jgi:hypothetical protein
LRNDVSHLKSFALPHRLTSVARLLVLLAINGCVTPSIPIPPPEAGQMAFSLTSATGTATFAYASEPNYADAIVYIYNRDLRNGIISAARSDGSVGPTQPFPAQPGQAVQVTFETDQASVGSCVVIQPDGSAAPFCDQ